MNALILIFILLFTKSQAACLPGFTLKINDFNSSVRESEHAIETFDLSMRELIPENHDLIIRIDSLNPRINADINRTGNEIVIQVMGGMLNHPEMKPEVLQLLLCHELGHLLGGPPLKSRTGWSSTEGQADYYSGLNCARILGFNEAIFVEAALKLTTIYAQVVREAPPSINQCDERVVERTNYGYPSVQCRLDTLMAGWNQTGRPSCWFSGL